MDTIDDILLLNRTDIRLLTGRYPKCALTNQTNTQDGMQHYRVVIPGENQYDDSYYFFLLDNLMAPCSRNFQARLENDESFRDRIKARVDANLRKMKENMHERQPPAAPSK